jgi:hypothetical protein
LDLEMSVTRNFGALDQLPLTNAQMMRDVGLLARERILRRTRQGIGTSGSPFHPYSAAYGGAKAAELGRGPVNLTVSGAMLNAIQILSVTEDTVTLGFKD